MGFSSKGSNTTSTSTQAPPWLQSAYQGVVGQAQQAAATPYTPYGGELVAPVNQQETAGIGAINQYANWAQPYLNAAAGYATNAAAPITQQQIQQYQNPESAAVTQATLANFADLNAQQNQQVIGNAISSGAWGGDRSAIAQTELAKNQLQGEAPALAGINLQSYNTGLQTALTEQQQQAQAAYSLGSIGSAAQSAGLTGAGAMIQGGQLQQGTQQAEDQARMQQYYTAMGYPFQTASWLAGIEGGIGGVAGGTSQTTGPAPNPFNTILGLGAAGAGAYLGSRPTAARGGGIHVPHFDGGGAAMPYSGGIGFIPAPASGGRGLMNPSMMLAYGSHPSQGQQGQPDGGGGGLGNLGTAFGKYLGAPGGIDTSGAGAGFPLEGSADAAGLVTDAGAIAPEAAGVADAGAAAGFSMADILPFLALAARGGRIRGIGAATGGGVGLGDMGRGFAGDDVVMDDPGLQDVPPAAMDRWRAGVDADRGSGMTAQPIADDTGLAAIKRAMRPTASAAPPSGALGFAPDPFGVDNPDSAYNTRGAAAPGIGAAAYAPNALNPNGGTGSSAPPRYTGEAPADDRSMAQRLSLPLMQAGFAMMASHSPFLGEAVGQGGLSGINAYVAQEHEARGVQEKQQEIKLRAQQLSDLAQQHKDLLAKQEAQLTQQKEMHDVPTGYQRNKDGTIIPTPGGPADPSQIRAQAVAKRVPGMDDEALHTMVQSYRGGNTGVLSGISRGVSGPDNLNRFWNMLSTDLASEGASGADLNAAKANFMAQSAAARTAAQREATISTAVNEAKGTFPLVLQRSLELPRTDYVPVNKLLQMYREGTSSPEQGRLAVALQGAITAYSQAMSRTGANTVFAQQHAENLLSGVTSHEGLAARIGQMQQEMGIAEQAPEQTRKQILDRILGRAPAEGTDAPAGGSKTAPATTAAPAAPQYETGKIYQGTKGPMKWTGTGFVPAVAAP